MQFQKQQPAAATLRSKHSALTGAIAAGSLVVTACATTEVAAVSQQDTRSLAYDESTAASSAVRTALDCAVAETSPLVARCAQCPAEPTPQAVARGFSAAESSVSACVPELERGASLRVRGEFASAGVALRFDLRGPRLGARQTRCLERALCTVRVPTFRTPSAFVRYEFGAHEVAQ